MSLPLPFLLGLFVLLGHGFFDPGLPTDPSLARLLMYAPALVLPALLAWFAPRAAPRFEEALIPIGYALLLFG